MAYVLHEVFNLAIRALELAVDRLVGIDHWIGSDQERRACFKEQRDCHNLVGVPEPQVSGDHGDGGATD